MPLSSDSKLIIVSNRLPITVDKSSGVYKFQESSGGLVTGLAKIREEFPSLWMGHSGVFASDDDFATVSDELRSRG